MSNIAAIESAVRDRLEENSPAGSIFWTSDELRPFIVMGLNEAAFITGEPEIRLPTKFTIPANTTLLSMPTGAIAIQKIETAARRVTKSSVSALAFDNPNWENDLGDAPRYWFPLGMSKWGIYPKLNAPVDVTVSAIGIPIPMVLPFSGTETIPQQEEYNEAFADFATHLARLKEGGDDFFGSLPVYGRFLSKMEQLSNFGDLISPLRFTKTVGVRTANAPRVTEK